MPKFALALLLGFAAWFQAAPPDTDVFLAPVTMKNGWPEIGKPINISNAPGYDNQPSFTPDGAAVLFTSARGGTATAGRPAQTDIYRYDIAAGAVARVTNTPESEYSPTVTPDGKHFSVIRVEQDGTQRLWRFAMDGSAPELVLTDIKPVGYHAWIDANTLALFVLGSPATLQLADARTGKAQVIAKGIGRSVLRMPNGRVSFVLREAQPDLTAPAFTITELNPADATTTTLTRAVNGATEVDLAWTADGVLLMAHGSALHGWKRGEKDWRRVADLAALGLTGVSRLALSPKGDRIAIVAQAAGR
jgi:hypothetical protein